MEVGFHFICNGMFPLTGFSFIITLKMMKFVFKYVKILACTWLIGSPAGVIFGATRVNDPSQLPESYKKFNFAIIGDRTGAGPDSWKILDRAITEMNRMQPDFAVMIGDAIEGSRQSMSLQSEWKEVFSHLDSLKMPLFLVPGNHDIYDRVSYNIWKEEIGDTYYSFSYQGCRFVVINTEEFHGTGEAGLGSRQMSFIRDQIQNQSYEHLFLFMHQPMWILKSELGKQWKTIEQLLEVIPHTVIAGHLHVLAAKRKNGKLMLIQGPTGGKMRMQRNPALGFFHHITWVTVRHGSPTVAFIEPGRVYGEVTALKAYQRYIQGMMLLESGQ